MYIEYWLQQVLVMSDPLLHNGKAMYCHWRLIVSTMQTVCIVMALKETHFPVKQSVNRRIYIFYNVDFVKNKNKCFLFGVHICIYKGFRYVRVKDRNKNISAHTACAVLRFLSETNPIFYPFKRKYIVILMYL